MPFAPSETCPSGRPAWKKEIFQIWFGLDFIQE
jgi:hypothetical protein